MNVRNLTLGTALGLCLALPAAAQDTTAAPATPDIGTVVATVGGTDITLGHMIALRERLPAQYQQIPDDALFDGLLSQLINQEALSLKAETSSPRTDLAVANERRALVANEVLRAVAEGAITDEAIEAAYQEEFGSADPSPEWNASHILVETQEGANALKARLDDGADFAETARENSTDASAQNGGSLGWFGPGMMVPEFEVAVAALEAGKVSPPFRTQFGWHIVRLNETREKAPPTLDEVRDQLTDRIQQQAVEAAVASAAEGIEVVRPDLSGIDPSVLSDSELID